MKWTEKQIGQHKIAANLLEKVKDATFSYIKNNDFVNEYDVQQFILKQFKENNLVSEKDPPIVGFNENASIPHYFPQKDNSKKIDENTLILVDIWARLDEDRAPYADITWMGFKGTPEKEIEDAFKLVIKARDSCVDFIKGMLELGKLPSGIDAHNKVCEIFAKGGKREYFIHGTGHSLGLIDAHGEPPHINMKNGNEKLSMGVGYTIEPGLYFKDKFGIRSEMNFYINDKMKMIITTPLQVYFIKL